MKKKMNQLIFSLLLLLTVSSCAQFQTHRTFLTEMEMQDEDYFRPREDFPVMAGDTGRTWSTDEEIMERVPRDPDQLAYERHQQFLREELHSLEESQSEEAAEMYQKHGRKLSTVSEKIYFLKLPYHEREEYLYNRGILTPERSPAAVGVAPPRLFGLRRLDIALGMSKDDILYNFGRPSRIEVAGNPSYENERWLYLQNGASKYIYFEAGKVGGWE